MKLKSILWRLSRTLVPWRFRLPYLHAILQLQGDLEDEIALVPHLASPDKIAIDVGANLGLYSYVLGPLFKRVEAFEPNPGPLAILRAYGRSNIHIHEVGLSDDQKTARLIVPLSRKGDEFSGCGHIGKDSPPNSRFLEIELRKLDDFKFGDVGTIKIDVEGHEAEVLAGATDTLRRCRPNLLVEIEQRHLSTPISQTFLQLDSLHYRGYFLFRGELLGLEKFSVEWHQLGYLERKQTSKYVNNFLFLPVEAADNVIMRLKHSGY